MGIINCETFFFDLRGFFFKSYSSYVITMAESNFLFVFLLIAIFMSIIKTSQYLAKKANFPQVLGEILAGIIIGPSLLNLLSFTESSKTFFERLNIANSGEIESARLVFTFLAEIAALFLLFEVGLEIDIVLLRKVGRESISTAIGGLLLPFFAGLGYILLFSQHLGDTDYSLFDVGLFLGVALTATSIGISIRVLIELERFDTKTTRILIGAAIIDDIVALLFFSLVLGYTEGEEAAQSNQMTKMFYILVGIATFFIIIVLIELVFRKKVVPTLKTHPDKYLVLSVTIILIFFLAWLAGTMYLAPIIGAFMSGVIIGRDKEVSERSHAQIAPIARWLVPFFFIAVGLRIDLLAVSGGITIILAVVLSIFAILSKVIGAGFGALLHDESNNIVDAIEVGVGMSPRGEVILLISTVALDLGVFSSILYTMIVVTVVITAVVAPILLRYIINLPSNRINSYANEL